jgi:hypothetical protein
MQTDINYLYRAADTSRRLPLNRRALRLVVADPDLCGFEFRRLPGLSRFRRPIVQFRPATGGEWKPYGTGACDDSHIAVRHAIAENLFAHKPGKLALRAAIYATTRAAA